MLSATRSADEPTPLWSFPLPGDSTVELFVKDESRRPTGSLKYGLARSLLADALRRGRIREGTMLIEATSGNLAVAEAYFARLIGLPFTAVVPRRTAAAKLARIEEYGGRWHPIEPPLAVYERAAELAVDIGGYHIDHLNALGDAVDHDESNLAAEILDDCERIERAAPTWIVTGVGTGATSRAIGRHLRTHGHTTRLAVVDPQNSAYFPGWASDCPDYATGMPSMIEGIGRPRIEPAFDPEVVDLVIPVGDAASVAAMRHLSDITGRSAGPSTGACLVGALHLIARMREQGRAGTVVVVQGDSGRPYADTYYDDGWIDAKGWDLTEPAAALAHFAATGRWDLPRSA
ncbi:pyridoxal-phosphate dependent enzyme [Nocardia sp. NEAU-G5]|uniref:Pyridoxal-phosphate dependent enzyme n=1 Tax=Nocardia albiluteola TaxID=2842303 RepID=A0ABS6AV86_9NOCA|nr:pyridoxal-phosphate dependent enzyme [Nocardia albiluteola]